jgi:hypothetical protein
MERRRPSKTDKALKIAARKLKFVFTTVAAALLLLLQFQF